ncbi:MAG: class I SAM-dependent methyltransferase [Pseudomonadota bacterium]
MTSADDLRKEQNDFWNGEMGETWAEEQDFIDALLMPLADILVAQASRRPRTAVLDIGCGNGTSTIAMEAAPGPQTDPRTQFVGIDLSKPMIENARRRATAQGSSADFILADAAEYDFGDKRFDLFASRFGVMFFADPQAAFSNLRRFAADDAEVAFVAWRGKDENDFMTVAARAAAPLLPPLPEPDPAAPGPFSLGDPDRVRALLEAAGWRGVELVAHDVDCGFAAADLDRFFLKIARTGHDLSSLDADARRTVVDAIRAGYADYEVGDQIRFTARCWMIAASA